MEVNLKFNLHITGFTEESITEEQYQMLTLKLNHEIEEALCNRFNNRWPMDGLPIVNDNNFEWSTLYSNLDSYNSTYNGKNN